MAVFPDINQIFRRFIIEALTAPVASGSNTGSPDLNSVLIKLALYTATKSSDAWNLDTDIGYNSAGWTTSHEVTSANYSAGGNAILLSAAAPTLTTGTTATGSDIVYGQSGVNAAWAGPCDFTAAYGLVYDSTSHGTNKWGIVAIKLASALAPVAGTATVTWSSGIFKLVGPTT